MLTGAGDRGCWLISEKQYGDLVLEYEFRLGPRGNSGLALRSPAKGSTFRFPTNRINLGSFSDPMFPSRHGIKPLFLSPPRASFHFFTIRSGVP